MAKNRSTTSDKIQGVHHEPRELPQTRKTVRETQHTVTRVTIKLGRIPHEEPHRVRPRPQKD